MIRKLYDLEQMLDKKAKIERDQQKEMSLVSLVALKNRFNDRKTAYIRKKKYVEELKNKLNADGQVKVTNQQKMDDLNHKLYDGDICDPKELRSLQEKLDEEQYLNKELLGNIDCGESFLLEADDELGAIANELKGIQQEFEVKKSGLLKKRTKHEQHIKSINKDIENFRKGIDAEALKWFDEKVDQFNGKPLSLLLENHACNGCMTIQSMVTIKQVSDGEEVYCENCQRRLILEK